MSSIHLGNNTKQESIDTQCRYRNPRTEERCCLPAKQGKDGQIKAYCDHHDGHTPTVGLSSSSISGSYHPSGTKVSHHGGNGHF